MSIGEAIGLGAILALASRALALWLNRRWFRQGFVGDASIHFVMIRTLRRNPSARWIDEYLISPEAMAYPTGFHRFAALFPTATIKRWPWLPNLVLWVGGISGFAGYVAFAARSLLGVDATLTVWLALAFVFLTPSAWVFRGPAVAYLMLSERLLGRLASSFAVLLLAVGTVTHNTASLIAATGAVVIAATSSVFSRQVLGFGLPLLALLWLDWVPLAVLAAGAVISLALARSRFAHGLRHTWNQWRLYPVLTSSSRWMSSELSRFVAVSAVRRALRDSHQVRFLLTEREPFRAMLHYPEIVLAGALLAVQVPSSSWDWAAPLVAFIVLFLATSTQRLNHLGEAYRYLEFGLYLLVPLELAVLVQRWSTLACLCLIAALAAWSVVLGVGSARGRWLRERPDRDHLSEFVEKVGLQPGAAVFPVTMALAADICARTEGVRSFWWQPGLAPSRAIYDEFIEELPYLKRDYLALVQRYGVTHVIYEKEALERAPWSYDFSNLVLLAEDQRYVAWRVPAAEAGV